MLQWLEGTNHKFVGLNPILLFDFSAVLGFILYPSSYNISVIGVFRSEKKDLNVFCSTHPSPCDKHDYR